MRHSSRLHSRRHGLLRSRGHGLATARGAVAAALGVVLAGPAVSAVALPAAAPAAGPVSAGSAAAANVADQVHGSAAEVDASNRATAVAPGASGRRAALPVGDSNLPERRIPSVLGPGIGRLFIVRGDKTATPARINVTPRGPWRINVVTIDPKRTTLRLRAVYGETLMAPDTTSRIARWAGARVAMNASFFNYHGAVALRGDPVGLTVSRGAVMSEQTGTAAEHNVLIDADRGRLRMGRFTWTGYVENTATGKRRTLAGVNRVPRVPEACRTDEDPQGCAQSKGELVRFSPRFAAATPSGPGSEAVYGPDGCLVRVAETRGTKLTAAQFSIQGTGDRAAQILREAHDGCVRLDEAVRDADGDKVALRPDTSGVSGRYRLVRDGKIVENRGTGVLFGRNPRSFIGRTADGRVMLVTIDGRSVSSVGTTLVETARIARSLGLVDAVNLDGGGSTTLAVNGRTVNKVSGSSERPVSDAIVLAR